MIVDALQGGAGTSLTANVNEVIANRAAEILGGRRGEYQRVHPLHHVNLHQSTNDVFPTALKIAAIDGLHRLEKAIAALQTAFQTKEQEFAGIVKVGRTQLQDACPMTLGAECSAWAEAFGRDRWRAVQVRGTDSRRQSWRHGDRHGAHRPARLHLPGDGNIA